MGCDLQYPFGHSVEQPLGFWSVDAQSRRSFLDAAMSTCFDISPAEGAAGIECERMLRWIHPEDRAHATKKMQHAVETKGTFSYSYRLRTPAGEFERVYALGRCFTGAEGQPTHVAGVLSRVGSVVLMPVEVQAIEALMAAHDLAKFTSDPMLPRLIEAVLLHAGLELAKIIAHPDGS